MIIQTATRGVNSAEGNGSKHPECVLFLPCNETYSVATFSGGTVSDALGRFTHRPYDPTFDPAANTKNISVSGAVSPILIDGAGSHVPLYAGKMPNFGRRAFLVVAAGKTCQTACGARSSDTAFALGNGTGATLVEIIPPEDPNRYGRVSVSYGGGSHSTVRIPTIFGSAELSRSGFGEMPSDVEVIFIYFIDFLSSDKDAATFPVSGTLALDLNGNELSLTDTGGVHFYKQYFVATDVHGPYINGLPEDLIPAATLRPRGIALWGAAGFRLDNGVPEDWRAACIWMAKQWRAGNKVLYPAWEGGIKKTLPALVYQKSGAPTSHVFTQMTAPNQAVEPNAVAVAHYENYSYVAPIEKLKFNFGGTISETTGVDPGAPQTFGGQSFSFGSYGGLSNFTVAPTNITSRYIVLMAALTPTSANSDYTILFGDVNGTGTSLAKIELIYNPAREGHSNTVGWTKLRFFPRANISTTHLDIDLGTRDSFGQLSPTGIVSVIDRQSPIGFSYDSCRTMLKRGTTTRTLERRAFVEGTDFVGASCNFNAANCTISIYEDPTYSSGIHGFGIYQTDTFPSVEDIEGWCDKMNETLDVPAGLS